MKLMKCPNCKSELKSVAVDGHYEYQAIEIDQCFNCGGIWFDEKEYHRIPITKVDSIDQFNEEKLLKNTELMDELMCPRDQNRLLKFEDMNFPAEIDIERCQECGGYWFNRGEYKDWNHIKRVEKPKKKSTLDPEIEKEIDEYLANESKKDRNENLEKLITFLGAEISTEDRLKKRDQIQLSLRILNSIVRGLVSR